VAVRGSKEYSFSGYHAGADTNTRPSLGRRGINWRNREGKGTWNRAPTGRRRNIRSWNAKWGLDQ